MTRRAGWAAFGTLLALALLAPACGKYGRPHRVVRAQPAQSSSAADGAEESAPSDEAASDEAPSDEAPSDEEETQP